MKVLNLIQGSLEWLAVRKNYFTASESSAMLGMSKHTTRTELLNYKTTGIENEINSYVENFVFKKGHGTEAEFLPIAEKIIGDDLSPMTGYIELDGMQLLASFDGITMMYNTCFEHKQFNANLAKSIDVNIVPDTHWPQLEQQLLVSGAESVLFVCSDGTEENAHYMFYHSVPARRDMLINGWKQFKKDLESHVVKPDTAKIEAPDIMSLPSVVVHVNGSISKSNLPEVTKEFDKFLSNAITDLKTDEDFALGEETAKISRDTAKKLKATRQAIIDQQIDVSEAVRIIDLYASNFDSLGLTLEKSVKTQKENIKNEIAMKAKSEFYSHVEQINSELKLLGNVVFNKTIVDFAGAMKNKRTIQSLHDAVDTLLSNSKIEADRIAKNMHEKLNWFNGAAKEHKFLFNDIQSLVIEKEFEFFKHIVNERISNYCIEEQIKIDIIRAEEEIKFKRMQEDNEQKALVDEEYDNDIKNVILSKKQIDALEILNTIDPICEENTDDKYIPEMVTITLKEYQSLKHSHWVLSQLMFFGVEKWEGYDVALNEEYDDVRLIDMGKTK